MRVVQAVFLAALLAVLSVIAIDLHRLVAVVTPQGMFWASLVADSLPSNETREQRIERKARALNDSVEESMAVLKASTQGSPKKRQQPAPPAR